MANLPSSFSYVNDVEFQQDNPNTQAGFVKLGSNDNYLKDGIDSEIATRIAQDLLNNGAGSYSDATVTTARAALTRLHLNATTNTFVPGRIQTMSGLEYADNGFPYYQRYKYIGMSTDRGAYYLELFFSESYNPAENISRSVLATGGFTIPVTTVSWGVLSWNSTFANMFGTMQLYRSQTL